MTDDNLKKFDELFGVDEVPQSNQSNQQPAQQPVQTPVQSDTQAGVTSEDPLAKFDQLFGAGQEAPAKVDKSILDQFDKLQSSKQYQSPVFQAADALTDVAPNKVAALSAASSVKPEDREEFLNSLYDLAAQKKTYGKQGTWLKAGDRIVAGMADLLGATGRITNAEGMTDDQRQFAHQIERVWQTADPLRNPQAAWYNPKEAVLSAAEMVPSLALAGAAGGAAGAAARGIGAGTKAAGAAEAIASASTFAPGMYSETYDTLIEEGVAPSTAKWAATTSAGLQSALFAGLPKAILPKSWTGKVVNKRLADGFTKSYIKAAGIHGPTTMAGAQAIDEAVKDFAKGESPDVQKYIYNAANTYLQSIGTFGVIALPGAIQNRGMGGKKAIDLESVKQERIKGDILKFIEKDQIPSRVWWKESKLPGGKSKADRYMGVRVMAREYQRQAQAEQPAAPEVPVESQATEAKPAPELQPEAQATAQPESRPELQPELAQQQQQELASRMEGQQPVPFGEAKAEVPATEVEAQATKLFEKPETIGIANAFVDTVRQLRSDPLLSSESPQTIEQWAAEAARRYSENPNYGSNLIGDLKQSERNANEVETVALNMEYKSRNDRFVDANNRQVEAMKSGDPSAVAQANIEARDALRSVNELEEVARTTGTKWGRSGIARRIELKEDFTPAGITRRVMTINGGKPLTREDNARVQEMGNRISELEARLKAVESGQIDVGSEDAIDRAVKELQPAKSLSKRKVVASKNIDDAWGELLEVTKPKEGLVKGESGALNVDVFAAYGKLAKAYAEYGVTTFAEFLAHAKAKIGDVNAESIRKELRAAWKQAEEDGLVHRSEFDVTKRSSLGRFARKTAKNVIEAGTRGRDAVVAAVHEEMKNYVPDITERTTKDLISGYGEYKKLNKGETETILRDISGQLQQLSKLEDMQRGDAPSPTGIERRVPTQEERNLIKLVNEAKKKGGFYDEDGKIKSALASAKTALTNRINDLKLEIKNKEKTVKGRTELKADQELLDLRAERDRVQKIHDEVFPREPISLEKRQQAVEKGLDRAIEELSKDIESGDIGYKKKPEGVTSPTIEAKRKTLEGLRKQREDLRESTGIAERRDNEAYRVHLMDRWEKLALANKAGVLLPKKPKKDRAALDVLDIKYQIKLEKDKAKALEERIMRENRTPLQKKLDLIPETINASRAILTSMDFSAVLRQGGIATLSHPILAAKALMPMFRAAFSEKSQFNETEAIRNRENALLYDQSKLAITLSEGKLTAQEEAFRGNLLKSVPPWMLKKGIRPLAFPAEALIRGVAGSERAYVTFLNRIRADLFDSMVKSLSRTGEVTLDEAKVIANYVNVATGRGNMGQWANASQLLSTVFFAPRYAVSRFQMIAGQPLWGGGKWGGTGRARVAVAKEYARFLTGIGMLYGTALLTNMFQTDENEKIDIEFDPRSADFGKIRYKQWRIDPLAGLSQATVFASRELSGETKKATGEIVGIRNAFTLTGAKKPSGPADSSSSVAGRFLRTKLSPWLGTTVSVFDTETPTGEKLTPSVFAQQTMIPLSFRDIYEQMQVNGVPRKAAFSILALFGMGSQKFEGGGSMKNFAEKIAGHAEMSGINKEGKAFNYNKEVGQVIKQARSLGLERSELEAAMIKDLKGRNYSDETIQNWLDRLRIRYP